MSTAQRSSAQLELIVGTGGSPAERHSNRKTAAARAARSRRLDAHTREVGREGVAQARAILSQVTPPEPPGHRRAS